MNRPSDITLPKGWTWEAVEAHRAKLDIGENMVPLVTAGGVVAWGTIDSVRDLRTKPWSSTYQKPRLSWPAAYWGC